MGSLIAAGCFAVEEMIVMGMYVLLVIVQSAELKLPTTHQTTYMILRIAELMGP